MHPRFKELFLKDIHEKIEHTKKRVLSGTLDPMKYAAECEKILTLGETVDTFLELYSKFSKEYDNDFNDD